jgi:hypothetical protein
VDPLFDPLRGDPRLEGIVERMNLRKRRAVSMSGS